MSVDVEAYLQAAARRGCTPTEYLARRLAETAMTELSALRGALEAAAADGDVIRVPLDDGQAAYIRPTDVPPRCQELVRLWAAARAGCFALAYAEDYKGTPDILEAKRALLAAQNAAVRALREHWGRPSA